MKAIIIVAILALCCVSLNAVLNCSCGYQPQAQLQWQNAAGQAYCDGNCCNDTWCNWEYCEAVCSCKICGKWCVLPNNPYLAYPDILPYYQNWCQTTCTNGYINGSQVDKDNCNGYCQAC